MSQPGHRYMKVIAGAALLIAAASVLMSVALFINAQQQRERLCVNQHSIIEMQELFLKEHAGLRKDLHDANIRSHEDPQLLRDLDRLIEAADCQPNDVRLGATKQRVRGLSFAQAAD
jgi:hypothetical protein